MGRGLSFAINVGAIVGALGVGWFAGAAQPLPILHEFLGRVLGDWSITIAVASALFAFLSILTQLVVGTLQARASAKHADASRLSAEAALSTARMAGDRAVAHLRIKWVESLRDILSEYHSTLMTAEKHDAAEERRLSQLGTQLDLMMNFTEANQKALWDIADEIYQTDGLEARKAKDPELMAAGRLVLKAEWEKIKRELRGGVPS